MVWETIAPILIGAGTGLVAAFVGYVKNIPKGESLDWKKALPALTMGLLVGFYAAFKGIDMLSSEAILGSGGAVFVVNYLWSAVWKFIDNKKNTGNFIVPN